MQHSFIFNTRRTRYDDNYLMQSTENGQNTTYTQKISDHIPPEGRLYKEKKNTTQTSKIRLLPQLASTGLTHNIILVYIWNRKKK